MPISYETFTRMDVRTCVRELTGSFPIALAFTKVAQRYGMPSRHEGLYDRCVDCIADYALLPTDEETESAINLLVAMNCVAFTTVVAETFLSNLSTNPLLAPLRRVWLEPIGNRPML